MHKKRRVFYWPVANLLKCLGRHWQTRMTFYFDIFYLRSIIVAILVDFVWINCQSWPTSVGIKIDLSIISFLPSRPECRYITDGQKAMRIYFQSDLKLSNSVTLMFHWCVIHTTNLTYRHPPVMMKIKKKRKRKISSLIT